MSAVLLTACSPAQTPDAPQPKTYAISGAEMGTLEEDVYKILGKPDSYEVNTLTDWAFAHYDGLSIAFRAGGMRLVSPKVVDGFTATSPNHCLNKDICPRATLRTVRERLGPAEIEPAKDGSKELYYILEGLEACWLNIYTEDEKTVSKVRLACQP